VSTTRIIALASIALGVLAILTPHWFGAFAVMLLGGAMLAAGVLALMYVSAARDAGLRLSVYPPWAQIVTGAVILIWPGLALWLVAVILGGGLILGGALGLLGSGNWSAGGSSGLRTVEYWLGIAGGALLIVMGATGSALLLSTVLGVFLIVSGARQWGRASRV
jgi:uncharacterized membrane protein HdeD (DUF308 family)